MQNKFKIMDLERLFYKAVLCLCLFLPLYLASCTAKHGLIVRASEISPTDTVWYMEVKLIPGRFTYMLPFNVLNIEQPYDLQGDFDFGSTNTMVLRYRFADELQLQEVRDRLLATGRIADIKITKSSN